MTNPKEKKIISTSPLTPHHQAIYDLGKKLISESLETGREFSKLMITVSTGAIPIYLGLVQLLQIKTLFTVYLVAPILFLLSSIIFIFSYFPRIEELSLDIISEIEDNLRTAIKNRNRLIIFGTLTFTIGILFGITSLFSSPKNPSNYKKRLEVASVFVSKNITSDELSLKLEELKIKINKYPDKGTITYKEFKLSDGNLIVALFETQSNK